MNYPLANGERKKQLLRVDSTIPASYVSRGMAGCRNVGWVCWTRQSIWQKEILVSSSWAALYRIQAKILADAETEV